ncbi:MAG: right-handed parallel beta-helix repeat-containing protein, partial [Planctomycetes bacterium]|nr:right-handed parallel beta-helix repeat-containing protein [Planctomycetota bacterium]
MIFYVSPEGNDDWNGEIEEPNDEQSDGPFRTLLRAREAVRAAIAEGADGEINVLIRSGTYYLEEPLVLGPQDSPPEGSKVSWQAYPGDRPVLCGGTALTGWKDAGDGIFRVSVEDLDVPGSLFENSQRAHLARLPSESYSRVAEMVEENSHRQFRYAPGDPIENADPERVEIGLWPGGVEGEWNWSFQILSIEDIDTESRTVTLARNANYDIGPGSRYFIQGQHEFLSEPGEFALDEDEKWLYYKPFSGTTENQEIVVPSVPVIVRVEGDGKDCPAGNIKFEGLDFDVAGDGEGVIHLSDARNVEIAACRIQNGGRCGVRIDGASQGCRTCGNEIRSLGFTGVYVSGPGGTAEYLSRDHEISNNHIHHVGRIIRHGAGVQLSQSGDSVISHNRIHHAPRYAISLKSPRPGVLVGKTIDGVEVTRDNAKDFAHARNNCIEFNDMLRVNTDSQDTGVFEAWGAGTGNVISNNHVHDSNIYMSFGFAIYLDDGCDEFLVEKNIVERLRTEGEGRLWAPLLIKGQDNRIVNNVVAQNEADDAACFIEMAQEPNRRLLIERNIFCETGDTVYEFSNHDTDEDWQEDRLESSERNLLWNSAGNYGIKNVPEIEDWEQWREILDGKYDGSSRIGNPRFVDPKAGDYRFPS